MLVMSLAKRMADTRRLLLPMRRLARHSSNLPTPAKRPDEDQLQEPPKRPPVPHPKIKQFLVEYHGVSPKAFDDQTLWFPIYKFPFIEGCLRIIKFKSYLTLFSLGLCSQRLLEYLLVSTSVSLAPAATLFVISFSSLLYIGNFSRQLICQIYTTEDLQYLRICRFSFYGQRRDLVLPLESVLRLSDTNIKLTNSLLRVKFNTPEKIDQDDYIEFYEQPLWISLKFGGVLDVSKFEEALGKLVTRRY